MAEVELLFQLTRKRVTKQHIIDFSPNDPGYPDYVRLWTKILKSGVVPQETEFDLSEVIGLTGWAMDPSKRFREYRRFTSAVGVALLVFGNDPEQVRIANYLARDLLIDLDTDSHEHLKAVRQVFPVVRHALVEAGDEEEYAFFTLGMLILAQMCGDFDACPAIAQQVIDDDQSIRDAFSSDTYSFPSDLLLGLTVYEQLHTDWIHFVSTNTNPVGDENIQLIIESFADVKNKYKPRR
ncbi:MAG: hypothetical protein AB8C95_10915 [Phycisphaeraceae bacterium]